jgi:hypothetical protein
MLPTMNDSTAVADSSSASGCVSCRASHAATHAPRRRVGWDRTAPGAATPPAR